MTSSTSTQVKQEAKQESKYKSASINKEEKSHKTSISENVFAQILATPLDKMDRKQKAEAIARAFAVDDTKDAKEQAERREELILMREFVLEELKNQHLATLDATNRNLTARMQTYVKEFNGNFLEYRKKYEPILRTIKAVGVVNKEGIASDVVEEIEAYKVLEAERMEKLAKKQKEVEAATEELNKLNAKVAELEARNRLIDTEKVDPKTNEKFRGLFGGLKDRYENEKAHNAAEAAALNKTQVPTQQAIIDALVAEVTALSVPTEKKSKFDTEEILLAKDGLEEMLNLSGEQLRAQQDDLIQTSTKYIKDADNNLKSLNDDYGTYKRDLENTHEKIDGAEMTLSILNAGIIASKDIDAENAKKYEAPVLPEGQEEDPIDKTERLKKKALFDEQNKQMVQIASDNGLITSDIHQQRVTVTNMMDTSAKAMANARRLKSQGITQLAAGAVTTVQALNNAAMDQSTKTAEGSLDEIREEMMGIMKQEVVREANGAKEISVRLKKAFEESADLGRLVEEATATKAENTREALEYLDELEKLNKTVRDSITDHSGITSVVSAEVQAKFNEEAAANQNGQGPAATGPARKAGGANPGFDITKS